MLPVTAVQVRGVQPRELTERGKPRLDGKPGGVKLVKLDKVSLESVAESKSDVFGESVVLVSGSSIYAVVKAADGKYYPAKFAAADLAEQARAKDAVMPYTLLREASQRLAGGDLAHRVDIDLDDEIGEVARGFNVMADQLLEQRDTILQRERRLIIRVPNVRLARVRVKICPEERIEDRVGVGDVSVRIIPGRWVRLSDELEIVPRRDR